MSPALLAPGLTESAVHAVAHADLTFLRRQLERHLFQVFELPGDQMHDRHGFLLHLSRALELPETTFRGEFDLLAILIDVFTNRPARRAAIVILNSECILEADVRLALLLIDACFRASDALRHAAPATQLFLYLCGPPPSFPLMDPAAQRLAASRDALKVIAEDLAVEPWSCPTAFNLGPAHRLTFSPFDWYYLSRGFRAADPAARWHCFEHADTLTFVAAHSRRPCIEGVFARVKQGMQLVGIRFEADPAHFAMPVYSDDPFTVFRDLCSQLANWQSGAD